MKTITKQNVKLELFKVNLKIDAALVEHKLELGAHNKSCVMAKLERLWEIKRRLTEFANA